MQQPGKVRGDVTGLRKGLSSPNAKTVRDPATPKVQVYRLSPAASSDRSQKTADRRP